MEHSRERYKVTCISLFPGVGKEWEEGFSSLPDISGEESARLLLVKQFYSQYTAKTMALGMI